MLMIQIMFFLTLHYVAKKKLIDENQSESTDVSSTALGALEPDGKWAVFCREPTSNPAAIDVFLPE